MQCSGGSFAWDKTVQLIAVLKVIIWDICGYVGSKLGKVAKDIQ